MKSCLFHEAADSKYSVRKTHKNIYFTLAECDNKTSGLRHYFHLFRGSLIDKK